MSRCKGDAPRYPESRALIVDGGGKRYQSWVWSLEEAMQSARKWQLRNKLESVTGFVFSPCSHIIKTAKEWDTVTAKDVRAHGAECESFRWTGKDVSIDES